MSSNLTEIAVLKTEPQPPIDTPPPLSQEIANMQKQGMKVGIVGRVLNGKVEIDQNSLDNLSLKYPGATLTFVAVNAPFIPGTCASGVLPQA